MPTTTSVKMQKVSAWVHNYEYTGVWGADGRYWLHVPKENGKEKAWLTLSEVERHAKAAEIIMAKQEQKDEDQAFRKIQLKVEDIQGRNCLTQFDGMTLTTDKLFGLPDYFLGQLCLSSTPQQSPLIV